MGTVASEKKHFFLIKNKKHCWFDLQEEGYHITFICPVATALLLHYQFYIYQIWIKFQTYLNVAGQAYASDTD